MSFCVVKSACTLKVFLAITVDPINVEFVKFILLVQHLGLEDLLAMTVLVKSAWIFGTTLDAAFSYGTKGLGISVG